MRPGRKSLLSHCRGFVGFQGSWLVSFTAEAGADQVVTMQSFGKIGAGMNAAVLVLGIVFVRRPEGFAYRREALRRARGRAATENDGNSEQNDGNYDKPFSAELFVHFVSHMPPLS